MKPGVLLRWVGVLALLVFLRPDAKAQGSFGDNLQGHFGFSLEFLPINYPDGSAFFTTDQLLYGIVVGGEYTLFQNDDFLALNLDITPVFSFNYSNVYGTQLFLQVPAYVVGRIGAGATKYSESLLGAAIGVGVGYTYANIPFSVTSNAIEVFRLKPSWVSPSLMAELSLNTNGQRYALRGHVNLSEYSDTEGLVPLRYQNWGIGLVYGF